MKTTLLPLLVLLLLVDSAFAAANMLFDGKPHSSAPYQNISNNASPLATRGTDFGKTPLGDSETSTFRVRNIGNAPLVFTASAPSHSDFELTGFTVVLPAQVGSTIASHEFNIVYDPSSEGVRTATLAISTNDPNKQTFTVNLRGEGTKPEVEVLGGNPLVEIVDGDSFPSNTDNTNFGSRDIFAGGTGRTFRLRNTGSSDLLFISGNIESGKDFSISGLPTENTSLAPGAFQNFIISFNPNNTGYRTAEVSIITNDSNEGLYTFKVGGTGTTTPDITVRGRSGTLPLTTISNGTTTNVEINGTKFKNTEVDDSKSNLYQVRNEGTATLTYDVSLNNPSVFKLSGNIDDSVGIGSSNSKNFSIAFEPTTPGTHSALVTVDSNDPDEDPYTFEIEGFATAPEITILGDTDFSEEIMNMDYSPRVGDGTNFLNVPVDSSSGGEKRTFRIKNNGTSALTVLTTNVTGQGFYISPAISNSVIPSLGHLTLDIYFNPGTDGQVTGRVTIISTDDDEPNFTFDITANGVGDPDLDLFSTYTSSNGTRIPHNSLIATNALGTLFPETELGDSVTRHFFIRNRGNGTLDYSQMESSPDFEVNGLGSSLEPNQGSGSQDSFSITFNPSSRGTKTLLIQITSNDPDTPSYNFVVEGKGVDPEMNVYGGENLNLPILDGTTSTSTSTGTNFGSNVVNSPGITRSFLIHNDGERDLLIVDADPDDDTHFTVTGLPGIFDPVEPNTSITIQVTFEPQSAGKKTTILQIINNDDDENPYNFRITGTGLDGPEISIYEGRTEIPDNNPPYSPDDIDYGNREIGQSGTRTFTIFNEGNQTLNIPDGSGVTAGKGFSLSPLPSSIPAGGQDTFTVTFAPTSAGTTTATVTILNDDDDEAPYSFLVTGTGTSTIPPAFDSFSISGTTGTLKFQTVDGVFYQVRQSTNLTNWFDLGAPIEGTGNVHTLMVNNVAIPGQPKLFYRIEVVTE